MRRPEVQADGAADRHQRSRADAGRQRPGAAAWGADASTGPAATASRQVINDWFQRRARSGNVKRAAHYFALPSKFQNATPVLTVHHTSRSGSRSTRRCRAARWRPRCGGAGVLHDRHLRLTERKGGNCGTGAGAQGARSHPRRAPAHQGVVPAAGRAGRHAAGAAGAVGTLSVRASSRRSTTSTAPAALDAVLADSPSRVRIVVGGDVSRGAALPAGVLDRLAGLDVPGPVGAWNADREVVATSTAATPTTRSTAPTLPRARRCLHRRAPRDGTAISWRAFEDGRPDGALYSPRPAAQRRGDHHRVDARRAARAHAGGGH